MYTHQ